MIHCEVLQVCELAIRLAQHHSLLLLTARIMGATRCKSVQGFFIFVLLSLLLCNIGSVMLPASTFLTAHLFTLCKSFMKIQLVNIFSSSVVTFYSKKLKIKKTCTHTHTSCPQVYLCSR